MRSSLAASSARMPGPSRLSLHSAVSSLKCSDALNLWPASRVTRQHNRFTLLMADCTAPSAAISAVAHSTCARQAASLDSTTFPDCTLRNLTKQACQDPPGCHCTAPSAASNAAAHSTCGQLAVSLVNTRPSDCSWRGQKKRKGYTIRC